MKYELYWFKKDEDECIEGTEIVDITNSEVKQMLSISGVFFFDAIWLVNKEIAKKLQPKLTHSIDLDTYDYYFEGTE